LAEHLFAPLGLTDMAFHVPPERRQRLARGFDHDPDGGVPLVLPPVTEPPAMESGGGGLLGTAADYARFLQFMLNKGELDGVRLLGPATVDYMTTDHLGKIPARDTLLEAGEGFGLGFAVRTALGQTPVPGSVGTYYWSGMGGTSFFVDPSRDLLALMLIEAPNQRAYYRQLFRNLVYTTLLD
jgi:CubicO group peptidase (beta-lactamase class C family)